MAKLNYALRDNITAVVVLVMAIVLSLTTIETLRQSHATNDSLRLVERCVLPEGDLCKGDPNATQRLLDELVRRVNQHSDQLHGVNP